MTVPQVSRHEFDVILEWCDAQSIECLYFLADMTDTETVRGAEEQGFHLVDVRVVLERTSSPTDGTTVPTDARIEPARSDDIPHLMAIAETSYYDTRFYHDTNFSRERCAALYRTWIEKSCQGQADVVFVARSGAQPVGYVTCHLTGPGKGHIGLVGVHGKASNQGVGRRLVDASLRWFGQVDVERVTVVTQGRNARAQRLYQRCGFVTQSMHLWYHRWFVRAQVRGPL